jgi:lipid-A-disaccharide synthase
MVKRIIIVVGEPSGDRLGAQLVHQLRKLHPTMEVEGVFGGEMIQAGCLQLCSMDTLSVMGLIEPLLRLPRILRMRKWLINYILNDPPDLYIGIDAPDFNLNIEKVLHKAGIQTVHYVSPSVWAWRQGRIKNIKRSVDLMLTLFPFEADFYKQHDVPVCYTGHPTADTIPFVVDRQSAKIALGYDANDLVIAVLPGSRGGEIKHMTRLYLQTMQLCFAAMPNLKFVMPLVQASYKDYVERYKNKIMPQLPLQYVTADSYAVMRAADFAIVTSGTATLELMLHKIPMIVAYKTDWLTYHIVKLLIKSKYIALPNLLADAPLVAEYIQNKATAQNLATTLLELINNVDLQQQQITQFNRLHKILAQNASTTAARAICDACWG